MILAFDTSISMEATDVTPSRLVAAREAAHRFIEVVPAGVRVGLVAFDQTARVIIPPTTSKVVLDRAIDRLSLGPGTAIGEAIYASLDLLESDVPADAQDVQPAGALSKTDVEHFAALGKLVGYLRWFHPSDGAARADWTELTRSAVVASEGVDGAIELALVLQQHFAVVAPTLRLFAKGRKPEKPPTELDEPAADGSHRIVYLEHTGPRDEQSGAVTSERKEVPWSGKVPPGTPR